MAALSSDEYKTVLAFFEKALEDEPEKHSYWYDIGFCKGRLGHWDEAVKALEKAIQNKHTEPAIFNLLGHAYIKLKQYDDAVNALKQALKIRPNSPNLLYKLAAAYFGKGELKTSQSTIRGIIKLTPNFSKAHFGLGLVCYYLEDSSGYYEQVAILNNLDQNLSKKLSGLTKG